MNIWRVPYRKFGDGPGLERVTAAAARLGVDLARFGRNGAVIVGSNGKGSTAAMTAALLGATGAAVGLFTSPHLLDLNERFRIGEDIADDELEHHWDRVRAAIEIEKLTDQVGGFEFLFLIAADWFAARGCTHTIWEAGLGGRLDPVRLIGAAQVALTSLDLEHTSLLGATLEAIALEKVAAAPPGSKLGVASSIATPSVRAVIADYTARNDVQSVSVDVHGAVAAPLPGAHQRENAALALWLARRIAPSLSPNQERAGFAATRWPGRLETLDDDPLTIIDVGHTPAGIRAALAGFDALRGERAGVLVCGASRDKEAGAIIGALAASFSVIICASARHKGAPAAEIAVHAAATNPGAEIVVAETVSDARRLAQARARAGGGAIYAAGGLFLAAEFKAVHMGRDPALLAFF